MKKSSENKRKIKGIFLELRDKARSKDKKTKNFTFIYFIIAFIVIIVINSYIFTSEVKNIPYSEFKDLITKGKISDVVIDTEAIQGSLSLESGKKTKFLTSRVDDPDIVKDLQKNNIRFSGQYENKFIKAIISWVLPFAIIILVWNLLMRKMGGAPSSVLNFGKSRGKIYGEDEIKITFEDVAGVDEAKEELKEIIEYLKTPDKFLNIGGKIPKGIL
ncbi:MAG: ATP-dependent metallopeptidase FtsH/Yme1/Tma family protein, partial [Deltaproteobacteria bacterium]